MKYAEYLAAAEKRRQHLELLREEETATERHLLTSQSSVAGFGCEPPDAIIFEWFASLTEGDSDIPGGKVGRVLRARIPAWIDRDDLNFEARCELERAIRAQLFWKSEVNLKSVGSRVEQQCFRYVKKCNSRNGVEATEVSERLEGGQYSYKVSTSTTHPFWELRATRKKFMVARNVKPLGIGEVELSPIACLSSSVVLCDPFRDLPVLRMSMRALEANRSQKAGVREVNVTSSIPGVEETETFESIFPGMGRMVKIIDSSGKTRKVTALEKRQMDFETRREESWREIREDYCSCIPRDWDGFSRSAKYDFFMSKTKHRRPADFIRVIGLTDRRQLTDWLAGRMAGNSAVAVRIEKRMVEILEKIRIPAEQVKAA